MPSSFDPSDPGASAQIPPAPIQEVLARANEGSFEDTCELMDRVRNDYPAASKEFLETISTILGIPEDVQGFDPTLQDIATVVIGLVVLTEIALWHGAGNASPIDPKVLVTEPLAKKYLFWSLIILRIPAAPTSSKSPLEILPAAEQLSVYYHVPNLYNRIFGIPGITYQTFPESLRPALINIALVWWTVTFDDEPPMYPIGRIHDDPHAPSVDISHSAFLNLLLRDTKAMIASIMGGSICTPELFVQRTLQRVRLLPKLNTLRHLSDLPPCTMEIVNMGILCDITGILMHSEKGLREVFMKKGAPGTFMKAFSTLGAALEARSTAQGRQSIETQAANDIESLLKLARKVVEWATSSPTFVLHHMNDVVSNGVIQLVSGAKVLRPNERLGTLDEIFNTISLHAPFLDVFPSLYKDTMTFLKPGALDMEGFMWGRTGHDYAHSARNTNFSLDVEGIQMMEQFVKKENRVRLCDNIKHHNMNRDKSEPPSQGELACSRCHSAVYCSVECQSEDWRGFHRLECVHMSKAYQDRKDKGLVYSYHDRAFQTSFMRYHYESLAVHHDRGEKPPYAYGRDAVQMIHILRPFSGHVLPLQTFIPTDFPYVPSYMVPRMKGFITSFDSTNGTYRGPNPAQIRSQNSRLIFRSFPFGAEDINVLVLLKRVHYVAFEGEHIEKMKKASAFAFRGPQARSDYLVQGALSYTSPPRKWARFKDTLPTFSELTGLGGGGSS